ncbi:glyoxalase [Pseudomonas sp. 1D4]|uniref:VOC family protein n=1 Tax=Pseudomonadaceae TaxID=135621 RepID=UPI00084A73D1|nr:MULTISPECIES: VOC family protein [Pseudomonas]OEC37816.1 glyoxalase [Pseudomonas sp. 1D4]
MLHSIELKTFVPARDFLLSQDFYKALGFKPGWSDDQLAYFSHGEHCAFLLQNFYIKEQAENFVMHLLVEEVDAWWEQINGARLDECFGTRLIPPQDQPWGMREFKVFDPSGVLWRISQNIEPPRQP